MLILIIAGGPDKGRIYELTDGAPIVLGREGDQVKLNDRKVSREHARLWSEGGQWYLKDLGSRHGTFRNHVELDKGQHAKLKDGDYLQIGNTVMVLGRMQANLTERSALLGGSPEPIAVKRSKAPMIAAGIGLAAVLGMGGYLAIQLQELRSKTVPREEMAALHEELAAMKERSANEAKQIAESARQMTESLEQTSEEITGATAEIAGASQTIASVRDPLIEQLEAGKIRARQQQLALEEIGDTLAKQKSSDKSDEVLAAVTQMKTLLADQPTGDQLVARLEEAINDNAEAAGEAVQLALAEHRKAAAEGAIASAKETEALMNRVLESLARVPTRDQLAEEVKLAVASAKAQDEQLMRLVLAELRRTGDQIATDVTAAVEEDAGQAQTLMKQVVSELAKRPTGEQLATDLREAMDEAFAKRDTNNEELPGLMRQVLSELEQRPTSEQLAADLRRVIGEDAQRTELLVARVMSEIDQRPTAEQIAGELQATDNESAARTAALLEEVLDKVETQDQLASQIAGLREEIKRIPGTNTNVVRSVLDRLDAQDRNSTAMLAAIAELRSAMPKDLPGQLDQVLAQLDKQVRTDQITDTIEESMQRIAAKHNKQTADAIAALSNRLDAMPSAEKLNKLTEDQAALAKLLDDSDAREDLGQLRASLQQLSEKLAQAGGGDEALKQIIDMLKKREKTELLIAELHDAMDSQSEKTEQIKKELMASIAEIKQPDTSQTLNDLLAMVRDRLITDESIRQAIRDEMRGAILPNQKALADARDVTTTASNGAVDDTSTQDPAIKPRRLTRLESAYKQSFETGRPVTVGAGVVDPKTGEVSKGRLIDPAVARALGFESWRDWYLTDRHAEQMRLQREALRQRNENEANSEGTVQLPPVVERSDNSRPEQD
ncbi:MAG: FHA domain-containing protein [Planctomycetota bacterium]